MTGRSGQRSVHISDTSPRRAQAARSLSNTTNPPAIGSAGAGLNALEAVERDGEVVADGDGVGGGRRERQKWKQKGAFA